MRRLGIFVSCVVACRPHDAATPTAAAPASASAPAELDIEAVWLGTRLPTHPDAIAAMAVQPGAIVAATVAPLRIEGRTIGADDPGVRVWHPDGRLRAHFGDAHVVAIAMVPGDRVATADVQGRVRISTLDGGAPLELGGGARVVAIGWIAARDRLAVVRDDGEITLLDPTGVAAAQGVGALGRVVTTAAIGRKRVVLGGKDGLVVSLDLDAPAAAVRPHSTAGRAITALAIAADDGGFVAGDMEGEVFVARIAGATTSIASANGWPVRAVAMMPSGEVVVSTSTQGQYLQVHAADARVAHLPAFDGPYDALVVDGTRLITGSSEGIVAAFDVATRRDLQTGARNVAAPRSMAFDAQGESLVTFAHPDPLRWSLADATAQRLVAPEPWPLAIASGGARAVIHDSERGAWAWHDVGTTQVGPWHAFTGFEVEVAFAGDVLGLAAHDGGQRDGAAHFELHRGDTVIAKWHSAEHVGMRGFVASADGTRWASLDGDDRPHVWTAAGQRVCNVDTRRLNAQLVFGRDAGELVLASQSHGLEILDATRCTTKATLWEGDGPAPQGTTDAIWALASSPGRGLLATGHGSGIVRMWSLVDGRELWSRHEQSKLVEQLVFDARGRQLASAAQDGSLVVLRW